MPPQPREPEDRRHQGRRAAVDLPPSTTIPTLEEDYPFRKDIQASLATPPCDRSRPAYQNLSIVDLPRRVAAGRHQPESTEKKMASQLQDALDSKGLVP